MSCFRIPKYFLGLIGCDVFFRVAQRNEERKNKAAASRQADKFGGYVSRNKNSSSLQESGLTSTSLAGGRRGNADQELDAESAAGLARVKETDAEIDAGIDAISRTMDNIANLSSQMRDEVRYLLTCFAAFFFSRCSSCPPLVRHRRITRNWKRWTKT